MCAYAAANLRNIWFTGEEHTKIEQIKWKRKGCRLGNGKRGGLFCVLSCLGSEKIVKIP